MDGTSKHFIVAVDDDPLVLAVLARIISRAAFEVAAFGNATEAKEAILQRTPDVVLSDIFLDAGSDGFEFIGWMQENFPAVPVVAMSGGDIQGDEQFARATSLGATAVMEKPVRAPVVVETLKRLLEGRA